MNSEKPAEGSSVVREHTQTNSTMKTGELTKQEWDKVLENRVGIVIFLYECPKHPIVHH